MKTKIVILISLFALIVGNANAADPRSSVIAYECSEVNQLVDEFECRQADNGMALHWNANPEALNDARRTEVMYHFNRIGLRYIHLGGQRFDVTADHFPEDQFTMCSATPDRRSFRCSRMECEPLNDGQQCSAVN